jgi:hypothetical protein
MTLTMVKNGEQHGLINTLANSVKDDGFKHMEPEWKTKAEKLRKEEAKIVKARYINHRGNHERLTKPYCRWAGDPIRIYHLIPGEVYELPYGFVKEVNESDGLNRRSKEDGPKDGVGKIEGKDRLHELVPVSF